MEMHWGWRYVLSAIALWLVFLACVCGAIYGMRVGWPITVVAALALVPALTAALQFHFAYRMVLSKDEFIRTLVLKRMIIAAAAAITVATAWSVGELIGLPHVPAWLIYPLFWGIFGVVSPLIRTTAS